jgi:large subunit ribosomal protein L21
MSPSYAIVESGGKQYRVEKGGSLLVDRLSDDEGAKVTLRPVMYRADKQVVLEAGELEKVKVEAKVAEHLRGDKIRIFKYKPKKGYRRRAGHRSELTRLEVTDVKMLTRKPAARKPAAEKPAAEAKPAADTKAAPKKPAAKKPAAKKPAARKPAAKKPAARKPAAKKPAAKKPASRRSSAKKET